MCDDDGNVHDLLSRRLDDAAKFRELTLSLSLEAQTARRHSCMHTKSRIRDSGIGLMMRSTLMQASKAMAGTICKLLLEGGASPRAKDTTGSAPLHRHVPTPHWSTFAGGCFWGICSCKTLSALGACARARPFPAFLWVSCFQ